jgi:hypothetical protein
MRRSYILQLVVTTTLVALSAPAEAQQGMGNIYEQMYGEPLDISLEDLVNGSAAYEGRAVRTRGVMFPATDILSMNSTQSGGERQFVLRERGFVVRITPRPEIAANFNFEAMSNIGRVMEVTGLFRSVTDSSLTDARGEIEFWRILAAPDKKERNKEGRLVSLETLVGRPGRWDGRLVRVVGQFRGRNLFGDLPAKSQRTLSDWVIKEDSSAAWVLGKPPRGPGFSLDVEMKRDSGKWIEITGRPRTSDGVVYLQARSVRLTTAPPPKPVVEQKAALPERPKIPPQIVFALPLDGEEVASGARFALQFSKDMDEGSFKGRVALRYRGPTLPGDRGFDQLHLTYDGGRRALRIDPADELKPGRELELVLLPGIKDIEGLELTARDAHIVGAGVADVLRFSIAF